MRGMAEAKRIRIFQVVPMNLEFRMDRREFHDHMRIAIGRTRRPKRSPRRIKLKIKMVRWKGLALLSSRQHDFLLPMTANTVLGFGHFHRTGAAMFEVTGGAR